MATTMPWGETVEVLMKIGFPTDVFKLDSAVDGVLDQDYLDGTLIGTDVSPYVQELSVTRGRSDQLAQIQSGTAQIRLVNNDRRFDPANQSSPYWDVSAGRTGIQPRREVVIKVDGVQVFVGRITDIDVEYVEPDQSFVTIDAADDFVLLANQVFDSDFTPTSQKTGARISAVLDLPEVDYPTTDRNIATGVATLGTTVVNSGTNVLTYLQEIAKAEQGYLFIQADGGIQFSARADYVFGDNAVEFADDGSGINYTTFAVSFGQEFLYNKIVVNRVGGTAQVADDVSSQTEYGISSLELSNLLFVDDSESTTLAAYLLDLYKEPLYRFDSVTVVMNELGSSARGDVLGIELSEPVLIKKSYWTGTPASETKGFGVQKIVHKISKIGHTVEFGLESRNIVYSLILDNATFGTLDSTNALG